MTLPLFLLLDTAFAVFLVRRWLRSPLSPLDSRLSAVDVALSGREVRVEGEKEAA